MLVDRRAPRETRGITIQVSSCAGTASPSRNGVPHQAPFDRRFANVTSQHVGQPEMRIARLGALAEAGSSTRGAVPPLEHIAFTELLACMQYDLRPGETRFKQRQRQHILQLVAIAGRSAKLVRASTAKQSRSVKLIGQPSVDQPVEVGPVGAHLDLAEPLGPGRARCRKLILARSRRPSAQPPRVSRDRLGAWPKAMAIFVSPPGGRTISPGERGCAPSIIADRAVACACLDHYRGQNISTRPAE